MDDGVDRSTTIGVYGHGGSGKTTLIEALLHLKGVITRRGKVEEGPQFLDYEPEAQRHHMSVQLAVASLVEDGTRLTFVDTPGYPDFQADAILADRVVDLALLVVDAHSAVEAGTEEHAARLAAAGIPLVVAVTREDREHADFAAALAELQRTLGDGCQPLCEPVGEAEAFSAVRGVRPPALVERVVEGDDRLLERYLEGEEIPAEEIDAGLKEAIRARRLVPVLPVSGLTGVGVEELLRLFVRMAEPMPESERDPAAEVFKTVIDPLAGRLSLFKVRRGTLQADAQVRNLRTGHNERLGQLFRLQGRNREPVDRLRCGEIGAVAKLAETRTGDVLAQGAPIEAAPIELPPANYRVTVRPATSGDEDRLSTALARQLEEDPSLVLERSGRDLVLAGYGELHFEVLRERLKRKFNVDVVLELPEVPYLETIRQSVKAEGKHKKQTGGHGQYGHVWLEIGPSEQEFEFVDKIFGGAVPIQYRPAVEKGVREAMEEGVLAGYPMTHVRCVLYDGSSHPVDSSEMAFKLAGALAFKKAAKEARPVLLEPIHEVRVRVPKGYTGEVMGDLTRRRGRILGIESEHDHEVVRAEVPLAEIRRYAVELRSLTGGRGRFVDGFVRYEEVPAPVAENIVAARRQAG